MFDLIIHNGRVVDYKNHLDQVTDIAVKDGRIRSEEHTSELRNANMKVVSLAPEVL